MKKILFVCYGLGIGGIETCLVHLLNGLPMDRFDIDVLLMNPEETSKARVRRPVRYLDAYRYVMNTTDTMRQIREHGGILREPVRFFEYCRYRLWVKLGLDAWKTFHKLPVHYDVAVAYSQNDYSPYYVIDKVDADRKVMWYHNGAYEADEKRYRRDRQYYPRFDYVVAVSSDCKKVLEEKFSFAKEQLIVLRNLCDPESVWRGAEAGRPSSFTDKGPHIVTVGRLTKEKGADLAVQACKELKERWPSLCWHWVGDGNRRADIQATIQQERLESSFLLEGDQKNPYPYMKYADIYVQPSYYEAYSTTVTEAKILGKPIVTTDVGGMRDQLIDGITGIIVPVSADRIAEAIGRLLADEALCKAFSARLKKEDLSVEPIQAYYQTVFR